MDGQDGDSSPSSGHAGVKKDDLKPFEDSKAHLRGLINKIIFLREAEQEKAGLKEDSNLGDNDATCDSTEHHESINGNEDSKSHLQGLIRTFGGSSNPDPIYPNGLTYRPTIGGQVLGYGLPVQTVLERVNDTLQSQSARYSLPTDAPDGVVKEEHNSETSGDSPDTDAEETKEVGDIKNALEIENELCEDAEDLVQLSENVEEDPSYEPDDSNEEESNDEDSNVKESDDKDYEPEKPVRRRRRRKSNIPDVAHACNICGKVLDNVQKFSAHMKLHLKGRNFVCEICGRTYKDRSALKEHKLLHGDSQKYSCDYCDKKFYTKNQRYGHMYHHHGHNSKPIICDECGIITRNHGALKQHKASHSTARPFSCKSCEKSFKNERALYVHSAVHASTPSHICATCGKGFTQKYNLTIHERIHNGVLPFSCPHCQKGFRVKCSMLAHKKKCVTRINIQQSANRLTYPPTMSQQVPGSCLPVQAVVQEETSTLLPKSAHYSLSADKYEGKKDLQQTSIAPFYTLSADAPDGFVNKERSSELHDDSINADAEEMSLPADTHEREDLQPTPIAPYFSLPAAALDGNVNEECNSEARDHSPNAEPEEVGLLTDRHDGKEDLQPTQISSYYSLTAGRLDGRINKVRNAETSGGSPNTDAEETEESEDVKNAMELEDELCAEYSKDAENLEQLSENVEEDPSYEPDDSNEEESNDEDSNVKESDDKDYEPEKPVRRRRRKSNIPDVARACNICGKVLDNLQKFSAHMKLHLMGRNFVCEICGKSYKDKSALRGHKLIHGDSKNYSCDYCDKKFYTRQQRYTHIHHHHPLKDMSIICDECGIITRNHGALKQHKAIHSTARPYSCQSCEKSFKNERALYVHSAVHASTPPHVCVTCGKGFTQKYNLTIHERIHNGALPFSCPHCQKGFRVKCSMLAHEKKCKMRIHSLLSS